MWNNRSVPSSGVCIIVLPKDRFTVIKFLTFPIPDVVLSDDPQSPEQVHVFDEDSVHAVNAALAAKRPLLIRGEPGTGKTQLAAAAAQGLGRAFVSLTVDSRTESRDLLWKFDAVRRLAQAQLVGALGSDADANLANLDVSRFVSPGPLWWAFNWKSALAQAALSSTPPPETGAAVEFEDDVPKHGCVVLIDEIDKGETDVPNGLLEALGSNSFANFGSAERICVSGAPPLFVVTTNEERTLPDAFLRRCLLLKLEVPAQDELIPWLIRRGKAHFAGINERVLELAAEMLNEDRGKAAPGGPKPGQAEFLDIVRAAREHAPDDADGQLAVLKTVRRFVLGKHAGSMP